MGWLLKFLLFLIVFYFILSKFEKMFRRIFGGGQSSQNRSYRTRNEEKDLHIDYRSKKGGKQHKNDFNGGEYVDYEEVD